MKSKFLFPTLVFISVFFSFGQDKILMDASNSIKIDELKEKLYKYSSRYYNDLSFKEISCTRNN